MNRKLGAPTYNMANALIQSKPIGDSMEKRDMYVQSWSREDISNQYLDKTMSK